MFIVCADSGEIEERFGQEQGREFSVQDTALAMENMLLKAADMGLGGCIIGAFNRDELIRQFRVREGHRPVALLPIGEPSQKNSPKERKALFEISDYVGEIPPIASAWANKQENEPFRLKKASLIGAEFEDLNLDNATFKDINMHGVSFTSVNLDTTSFSNMYFGNSKFKNMNLSGSSFQCGSLDRVKIGGCEHCEKEGIACIQMRKAEFDNVDMSGSMFNHCNYEGSVMTDIRMCSSKIYDVDMDGSDFSGVNMVGAKLRCVNLFGSEIKNSNFTNVHMDGCDIDGFTVDGIDVKSAIEAYKNSKNG